MSVSAFELSKSMERVHLALHDLECVAVALVAERDIAVNLLRVHRDAICRDCVVRHCEDGGVCVLVALISGQKPQTTAPQPPTRAIPCPIDESIAAPLIEAVQSTNNDKPGLTDAGF